VDEEQQQRWQQVVGAIRGTHASVLAGYEEKVAGGEKPNRDLTCVAVPRAV
jgi:hypothetical protein